MHFAPNLGWREAPFGARLASRLRSRLGLAVPILCRNDANLGAVAEHIRGVGSGIDNLVYLYAEVGVGGAVIVDGSLLEGASGYGGEVGHMRVNPEGAPVPVRLPGCWETEVGEDALVTRAGRKPGGRGPSTRFWLRRQQVSRTRRGPSRANRRMAGHRTGQHRELFQSGARGPGGAPCRHPRDGRSPLPVAQMRAGVVTRAQLRSAGRPSLGRESVLLGAAEVALEAVLRNPRPGSRVIESTGDRRGVTRPAPVS